jgi:hypothetical protein
MDRVSGLPMAILLGEACQPSSPFSPRLALSLVPKGHTKVKHRSQGPDFVSCLLSPCWALQEAAAPLTTAA